MGATECKVLYDYTKQQPDELNIVKGDIAVDIDKIAGEWWKVTLMRTGERGLVPSNYVEISDSQDPLGHNQLNLSNEVCKFPLETITFEKFMRHDLNDTWWFEGSVSDHEIGVIPVALKTWRKQNITRERYYLGKAKIMSQLNHENIMKFIGVHLSHCGPSCIVSELTAKGNLSTFLCEACNSDVPHLSSSDRFQLAIDVARGCQYLQEQQIVHFTIMARNCYVVNCSPGSSTGGGTNSISVKIGGFDLAVKIKNNTFKTCSSDRYPIKWTAPELLNTSSTSITTEVDKWSYGIVLYEIFSSGKTPYPELQDAEVVGYVSGGGRLNRPTDCPDNMYKIMCQCWELVPDDRITYGNILLALNHSLDGPPSNDFSYSATTVPDLDSICTRLISKYHEDVPLCDDDYIDTDGDALIRSIPLANLQILGLNKIGSSSYAAYHEGMLKVESSGHSIPVTVKTLEVTGVPVEDFLSEAKIIWDLRHENVIQLFGACLERDPVCTVMERFSEKDSLQTTLRATHSSLNQHQHDVHPFQFSLANCLQIAIDIAEACVYLQIHQIIHTFISACNCYLFHRDRPQHDERITLTTKLGGFNSAIRLDKSCESKVMELDSIEDCSRRIKWSPPEVLAENKYILESDIWSYGILLWELFSNGTTPYPNKSNEEAIEFLTEGNRLNKPVKCPQKLYSSVMRACWKTSPTERIRFGEIISGLREHIDSVSELEKSLLNEEEPSPPMLDDPITWPAPKCPTPSYEHHNDSSECEDNVKEEQTEPNENEITGLQNGNEDMVLSSHDSNNSVEVAIVKEQKDATEPTTQSPEALAQDIKEDVKLHSELFTVKKKQISARLALPKNRKARGIIFIVGVYGADGTEIDVENVERTFKELNFVTYIVQDPPADEISALIQAAADVQLYPYKYEYVAFYFAGHGGRDEEGKMFIVGLQRDDERKEILYVDDHIINPLKCLHERKLSRLFFFDCCQSKGEGTAYRSVAAGTHVRKKPKPHPGEIIAYATNDGEKSWGDRENGGIWTYHLCKNIRELDEPITTILSKTYDDVVEARDSFQQPLVVASLGLRKLKGYVKEKVASQLEKDTIDKSSRSCKIDHQKPITVQTVYTALVQYSSHWDDFAYELEVDDDYRDTLEDDNSLSDKEKLQRVITQWIEKGTCEVSWEKIITVTSEGLELETESLEKASKVYLIPSNVWREVIDCLKHKASYWSDLAQELGISDSFQDKLEQSTNINDRRKLEKVIKEWLDESKGYEPTWEKIIEAVNKVPGLGEEEIKKLKRTCHSETL